MATDTAAERSEKRPFLWERERRPDANQPDGGDEDGQPALHKHHRHRRCQTIVPAVLLYIPAIILFILSYWNYSRTPTSPGRCVDADLVPSPAQSSHAVQYEARKWPLNFQQSAFAGDPSPELDLAWHNLFEDVNIRVSGHDLQQLGLTSLPLADGGYVAQLGVYHELHCIKKIRHWIYKDYYVAPKNLSQAEWAEWPAHVNHCIEMLRLSAMCRGDTALSTFDWLEREGRPRVPTAVDKGPHRCVRWEVLAGWVRERAVDIGGEGVLGD